MPQAAPLLGADLFWQWLVLEPGPFPTGAVSRALRTTIVP